jgi:hypothetical protein
VDGVSEAGAGSEHASYVRERLSLMTGAAIDGAIE